MATLPVPKESEEHRNLVAYLQIKRLKFTHVANETGMSRTKGGAWRGVQNKRNGVSPGFPDFLIIVDNQLIAIELKRQKGSKTSPEQIEWHDALNEAGIPTYICKGFDAAREVIEAHLVY